MTGSAAAMVHALKYGGWRQLADLMAAHMAETPFTGDVEAELAMVIPVPLSQARLRERGFNQAELLARAVARDRGLPLILDTLRRSRHTRRQASLSPRERLTNVSRAFNVTSEGGRSVKGQHLLLIDDVLTTAATVQDCVRALCWRGARAVSVLTFARARRELLAAG